MTLAPLHTKRALRFIYDAMEALSLKAYLKMGGGNAVSPDLSAFELDEAIVALEHALLDLKLARSRRG